MKKVSKIDTPPKWPKCHLNDQNHHFVKSEPPGPAFFEFQGVPRDPVLRPKLDPPYFWSFLMFSSGENWHFWFYHFVHFHVFVFFWFCAFCEITIFWSQCLIAIRPYCSIEGGWWCVVVSPLTDVWFVCCFVVYIRVGEITQGERLFLYSRSPLSEPELAGVFLWMYFGFRVGEITQGRCNVDTLVLPSLNRSDFVFWRFICFKMSGRFTGEE